MKKHIATTLFLALCLDIFAQTLGIDSTFGETGIIYPASDYWSSFAINNFWDIDVMDDGKIVAAGHAQLGSVSNLTVVKFLEDGFPDVSFGDSGVVFLPQNEFTYVAWSLVTQPDSKIIVAGDKYFNTDDDDGYNPYVFRLNSDGSFDKVLLDHSFGYQQSGYCTALAIQTDGSIIAAGYSYQNGQHNFSVFRINDDGNYEEFIIPIANTAYVDAVGVQSDGKIIVAGGNKVFRLKQNGALDTNFGVAGSVQINQIVGNGTLNSYTLSMTILPNDKILLAGTSGNGTVKIGRIPKNGGIDIVFTITDTKLNGISRNSIVVEESGNIVVVGKKNADFALSRIGANGGFLELITNNFNNGIEIWTCVDIQNDGGLITAGYAGEDPFVKFVIARYKHISVGSIEKPSSFTSLQVYPNPTSTAAVLRYSMLKSGEVSLALLDVNGKLVSTFIENEFKNYGEHTASLNIPAQLPRGVYFLQLSLNGESGCIEITLE